MPSTTLRRESLKFITQSGTRLPRAREKRIKVVPLSYCPGSTQSEASGPKQQRERAEQTREMNYVYAL